MDKLITKGELVKWLVDPTTKKVRAKVGDFIQEIMEQWAENGFVDEYHNAFMRGKIAGMLEVFEIEDDE